MVNWIDLTLFKLGKDIVSITCLVLISASYQIPALPQSLPATESETANFDNDGFAATYTLGPGDQINIVIFGAPEYSGQALVLPDGSLNLPTAGSVLVQGMSLQQAAATISAQYAPFLRRPLVTVTLATLRPVRVSVAGEVNRPGSYIIDLGDESEFPTVTDAIKLAGGITSNADLRRIEVQRQQTPSSAQTIELNLWEMLEIGGLEKDIILQGGDTILIPTATAIDPTEATRIGSASFAPDTITVYVVGEVTAPGAIEIPPNTPLNQAILAAGGFDNPRAATTSVELVRLNENGTVSQRDVSIDFSQGINEDSNPVLHSNDVVVVNRSGLANFSDTTDLALGPFGRILSGFLGILNIFR